MRLAARNYWARSPAAFFMAIAPCAMAGIAQPAGSAFSRPAGTRLQRVDQGFSDVGPSQVSQRDLGADLRVPTGFGDVYRVQGGSKWGRRSPDSFARIDGGVVAVFPRSVYTETQKGVVPEIPPGTIFYLGHAPGDEYNAFGRGWGAEDAAPGPTWADTRFDSRVPGDEPARVIRQPAPGDSADIMTDEALRKRAVRALLLDAANAHR